MDKSDLVIVFLYAIAFFFVIYFIVTITRPAPTKIVVVDETPSVYGWWPWSVTSYNWWPYWGGWYVGGGDGGYYRGGYGQRRWSGPGHISGGHSRPWGGAGRGAHAGGSPSGGASSGGSRH